MYTLTCSETPFGKKPTLVVIVGLMACESKKVTEEPLKLNSGVYRGHYFDFNV